MTASAAHADGHHRLHSPIFPFSALIYALNIDKMWDQSVFWQWIFAISKRMLKGRVIPNGTIKCVRKNLIHVQTYFWISPHSTIDKKKNQLKIWMVRWQHIFYNLIQKKLQKIIQNHVIVNVLLLKSLNFDRLNSCSRYVIQQQNNKAAINFCFACNLEFGRVDIKRMKDGMNRCPFF